MSYLEYKYKYIDEIKFETTNCVIADGRCPINGDNYSPTELIAYESEFIILKNLRIKEHWLCFTKVKNFGKYAIESNVTDEVLDMAINSTVSRTVITSLTTLMVVTILLVFGGSSIKGFAFALFVGIIVGTYSSIFVATPIVRDFTKNLSMKKSTTTDKQNFSKAAAKAK